MNIVLVMISMSRWLPYENGSVLVVVLWIQLNRMMRIIVSAIEQSAIDIGN